MRQIVVYLFCLLSASRLFAGEGTIEFVPLNAPTVAMGYGLWRPVGFTASAAKYPVIVWIGGTGEQGDGNSQLNLVTRNGPLAMLDVRPTTGNALTTGSGSNTPTFESLLLTYPALVVQPQLPGGVTWENSAAVQDLHSLLHNHLNTAYPNRIDYKRIWVGGFSLGGGGAWCYGRRYGTETAAIMPLAGAATAGLDMSRYIGLPVWASHAADDGGVPLYFTKAWMSTIAGSDPGALVGGTSIQYRRQAPAGWISQSGIATPIANYPATTTFSSGNHNWVMAGRDTMQFWKWLFAQSLDNRPLVAGYVVAASDTAHTSQTGSWTIPDTAYQFAPLRLMVIRVIRGRPRPHLRPPSPSRRMCRQPARINFSCTGRPQRAARMPRFPSPSPTTRDRKPPPSTNR